MTLYDGVAAIVKALTLVIAVCAALMIAGWLW
jgi:hypothetical protein